jgi:hypothetical protein
MSSPIPTAKSASSPEDRDRLRRVVQQSRLCGLANDTKWNEFIDAMRAREGWKPKFRCKCGDGIPSEWDGEWFYHLPFPLLSLEWLDLAFIERKHCGRLIAPVLTDHSAWLEDLLTQVGFEYQRGSTMIRIFGYSPKNFDLFDKL